MLERHAFILFSDCLLNPVLNVIYDAIYDAWLTYLTYMHVLDVDSNYEVLPGSNYLDRVVLCWCEVECGVTRS